MSENIPYLAQCDEVLIALLSCCSDLLIIFSSVLHRLGVWLLGDFGRLNYLSFLNYCRGRICPVTSTNALFRVGVHGTRYKVIPMMGTRLIEPVEQHTGGGRTESRTMKYVDSTC